MGLKKLFLFFMLCFVAVGVRAQTQPLQPINARYLGIGAGGGTADAQTVTYTPATTAYASFQVVTWLPTHSNATTTPTLSVDGLAAKTIIKTNGSALIAGDISTTNTAMVMYDGTAFELLNPQNAYSGGTPINAPGLGTDANGNLIAITPSGTSPGPYIAPQAVSGCGVDWTGLLNFTVGACTYIINGVTYTSVPTNLTDSAADPSNPRIDVIFVDTSGVPQILDGTPAGSPATPVTDPSTQLVLEPGILVNANGTTPANITRTLIYDENVEWTTATGGTNSARVNVASTNNPYSGSLDVEFGNGGTVASTTYVSFTKPAAGTIQLGSFNFVVFYLRNKAAWPAKRSITAQWYNGATPEGTPIVLSSGSYGLNTTTNTTTYQQVSIPTSVFGINNVNVTTLRITVTGTGAALTGFYFDLATVQSGLSAPLTPNTLMNFRGNYSPAVTYAPNDVVISGGMTYVALIQNLNVAVSTTSTWAQVVTALPNGVTATTQSQLDGSTKVATTSYTDTAVANAIAGVNPAVAVLAASTASLTGTYAQVGGGVGDTFTVTATGAFTLDGIAINTIGQRVLLKNQVTASQNGVYTATVVGTVGVSPVFTRATDYDTPSDVNNTGVIPVQSGTVNGSTGWQLTSQVTSIGSSGSSITYALFVNNAANVVLAVSPGTGLCHFAGSTQTCTSSAVVGSDMTNATVTATQLAAQYSKGSCTEAWGGSGTSFAMTSGDDAVVNNACYNDSGVTRTITAVKCRADNASNTTVLTPTYGSAGTGTAILTGTLTCGNSYAYSSTGTLNNTTWATGNGIDPGMSTVGNATSIAMIVEYTY